MATAHESAATTDRRSGFSLLELTLVLALLATLAAIAWPTLQQSVDDLRLRRAADQVRAAWASARNDAVTTGRIAAFRCRAGETRYCVEPFELEDRGLGVAAVSAAADQRDIGPNQGDRRSPVPAALAETNLPKGVTIVATHFREQPGDRPSPDLRATAQSEAVPILFFADGTASDCQLTLVDERGWRIHVTLRAITGISTASNLVAPEATGSRFDGP
ncbi:MAG: prepilin-type N-terminal cleavage/methylation domain-containing protein [Pirellulales bacterium]